MSTAYAKTRTFWMQAVWGIFVGLVCVVETLAFLALMQMGTKLIWPDPPNWTPYSGSVRILVIMTIAGLIVGLIHQFFPAEMEDEFEGMAKGGMAPRPVPGSVAVALTSLVGGFSLGPEVPTGILAGGTATWLSKKGNVSEEVQSSNVYCGIAGAWGGLFTTPFGVLMMPLEISHQQTHRYYGTLFTIFLSGLIGFAIFYAIGGFAEVLRVLNLPAYDLKVWHLLIAIVLGAVGAILGLIFGITTRVLKKLTSLLSKQPIILSTAGGALLGLLGMAVPLSLFLGTAGLKTVAEHSAQMGVALIILFLFAKLLATSGALATGFIGGPIFPLLFVGGSAGAAISMIFPELPLALSMSCMMAAVPAALLPTPLALGIIVMLIVGTPPTEAAPVFVSVLVAYFITNGLGFVEQSEEPEKPERTP